MNIHTSYISIGLAKEVIIRIESEGWMETGLKRSGSKIFILNSESKNFRITGKNRENITGKRRGNESF